MDDEVNVTRSLVRSLGAEFEVFTAPSGAEALSILDREIIQVLLTDQRMPQLSGVELLQRAWATHPLIRAIVFSGYTDPA